MVIAPALMLALAAAAGDPAEAQSAKTPSVAGSAGTCKSADDREILVCAPGSQGYRLNPDVRAAERGRDSATDSATAALPPAQASCSASPMGCGKGLEGLDLMNVGLVLGTMAVKAAKGGDWAEPFRVGGPDEYQVYLKAKQLREARAAAQAARRVQAAANAAAQAK